MNLKELIGRLNPTARRALEGAVGLCMARTHYDIEIEHLLVKLIETPNTDFGCIALHFDLDLNRVTHSLERALGELKPGNAKTPAISPEISALLSHAWMYASIEQNTTCIRTGFLLAAALEVESTAYRLRNISDEFNKIVPEELRKDFFEIAATSSEQEPVSATTATAAPKTHSSVPQSPSGPSIFLSYRRKDKPLYSAFLLASLQASVPRAQVFRDSYTLQPGAIFADEIRSAINSCDIFVAIIGRRWVGEIKGTTTRRIDSPDDWIHLEVASALQLKKHVVPCLIDGARMPVRENLPSDIADLCARQAVILSPNNLTRDAEELNAHIRRRYDGSVSR
jgi:hypothetical protein